jgi:hypothetical protein
VPPIASQGWSRPSRPGPWLVAGMVAIAIGAALLVVCWYRVSGTAYVSEQLPYLVSAGFGGLAFIVAGGAALIADRLGQVQQSFDTLIAVATEPTMPAAGPGSLADESPSDAANVLTLSGGSTFHEPGCPLLAGKDDASISSLPRAEVQARGLTPCPVCHR